MDRVWTETLSLGDRVGRVRRARGRKDLVTLVLIPGCGADHTAFDPLLDALLGVDVGEVIVPCLPGRAGLPGPAPDSAGAAAGYVLGCLDALGVDRAVIGGHSYGGGVAIEVALQAPGRVAGLVLMDTGARLRAMPAILLGAEAAVAAAETPEERELASANLADWRACHAFDRMAEVPGLDVPTLVLCGADDVLTPPRYARWLAEHIPGATLRLVDGADHDAPSTHAAVLAQAIAGLITPRPA